MTRLDAIEEKYQLLHKLAEGGMGAVYKVRHRLLDEPRVVKVVNSMHATNEAARRRFEQEAKAATMLRHPHIAQIYDFVIDDEGGAYLVMEYIDGVTLKQLLHASGPPPFELVIEIAIQSLEALDYLHDRGYVHRDVAPDNLMLSRSQKGLPLVKVIDLGLAKRPADRLDLTATNMFVGKVRYSSPEVFRRGKGKASPQSDLYSFGVVFYELLTGACPIRGSSFEELATAHLLEPPPDFKQTDPENRIPQKVRDLVMQALAKEAAKRPRSAQEMADALASFRRPAGLEVPSNILPVGDGDPTLGFTEGFDSMSGAATLPGGRMPGLAARQPGQAPEIRARQPRQQPAGSQRVDQKKARSLRQSPPRSYAGESETEPMAPSTESRSRRRRLGLWLAASALALVAAWLVGLSWWQQQSQAVQPVPRPALAPAFGRLVIDAVPWGRITSVLDAQGREVPIGQGRDTPRVLALPAGDYEVRVQHPDFPPSGPIRITVPVAGTARIQERLGSIDVDDYFKSTGLYDELMSAGSGAGP